MPAGSRFSGQQRTVTSTICRGITIRTAAEAAANSREHQWAACTADRRSTLIRGVCLHACQLSRVHVWCIICFTSVTTRDAAEQSAGARVTQIKSPSHWAGVGLSPHLVFVFSWVFKVKYIDYHGMENIGKKNQTCVSCDARHIEQANRFRIANGYP